MVVKEVAARKPAASLPEGWRMVRLGDVVRNVDVAERKPLENGLERYVGLDHLDPESLHIKRWGLIEEGTSFTRKFVEGQVLFGKRRAYQRKAAVAEFDGICSGDILVFEPKGDELIPELLPFIVQSDRFFEHALSTSAGSLSPRTKWKDLASYEFALPPKDEQHRIAGILWAADEMQERFNDVVSKINEQANAYWHEMFAKARWKTVQLGDIADISNGSTPSRKVDRYWAGGDIAWLPTQKVHDRIIRQADEFVTHDALKECSIRLYPVGSVLIAMIGEGKTRGSVAYLDIEACINQNFACAVPNKEIDGWFLFHFLNNCYEQLRNFSHGSNQGALNCRILREFPVQLPPKEEQLKIVKVFRALDAARESAKEHISSSFNLKKQLLSNLLRVKQPETSLVI